MRKQKSITLIALVVTIIVLLILAAVSITALTDDEKGVVTKAKQAAQQTEDAATEEDEEIEEILDYADSEWENTSTSTSTSTNTNTTTNTTTTTYTVTFSYKNSSGNATTKTVSVASGGSVTSSQFPSVSTYTANNYTYTFSKWINSSNSEVTSLSNVTSNQTITAVYTSEYICFVAGTKVLTEDGLVNIEDIQVGMKVYSKNEATGEVELKEVKGTFINYVDYDMTKVTVNGEVIESTDGHEYYEVTKGWIDACKLEAGDKVLNSNNEEILVEKVETTEYTGNELTTVYNIDVADNNNYFVGDINILVHNYDSPTAEDSCSSTEKESPTA